MLSQHHWPTPHDPLHGLQRNLLEAGPVAPSDIFPAAWPDASVSKTGGKELIVGSCSATNSKCASAKPPSPESASAAGTRHTDCVRPRSLPDERCVLNWEQSARIGISASRHCTLGAVTAGKLT